jgi:putative ABC transport system permease protein
VKALDRKLLREVRGSAGGLGAIVAILALGVTTFVGLLGAYHNLSLALNDYYARCRMPDFWVELKKAPIEDALAATRVPGVGELRHRVEGAASVDWPDRTVQVRGMIRSLPDEESPVLAGALLSSGQWFSGLELREVILSHAFATAHALDAGDTIPLVIDGTRHELKIVGTALSSEAVYLTPPGAVAPDPALYGIFFVRREFAEDALGMRGATNALVGQFLPGVTNDDAVLDEISEACRDFGVFAAYSRDEQASNLTLESEIRGLRVFAVFMPMLFFGAAALVLNVLMKRTVERQRVVIGTLKAMGSTDGELVRHFLGLGVLIGLAGGIGGIVLGEWSAGGLTRMYTRFFEFPSLVNVPHPEFWVWALFASLAAATLGSLQGVRKVLALAPAEAMRPAPPPSGGKIALERVDFLWSQIRTGGRIVLRNLFRHPARSTIGIGVAALGASLVFTAFAFSSAMSILVDFQFERVLRSDYTVTFTDARGPDALDELARLPGVSIVEPQFAVAGEFRVGNRRKRVAITGIASDAQLNVPFTFEHGQLEVPAAGLLMSHRLAATLGVQPGDLLQFEPATGRRETLWLPLAGTIDSMVGLAVQADLDWLRRVAGEEATVTGAQLSADQSAPEREEFYERLRTSPGVAGVTDIQGQREQLESVFFDMMYAMTAILVLFASVIFFGAVLNSSLISLSERKRELATLRALGWTPREVGRLLLHENLAVNVIGIGPGLLLGWLMFAGMTTEFQTDLFAMPTHVEPWAFFATAVLSPLFVMLAHSIVRGRVRRSPWLAELGAKE